MTEEQKKVLDEIYKDFCFDNFVKDMQDKDKQEKFAEDFQKDLDALNGDDGQHSQELTPDKK